MISIDEMDVLAKSGAKREASKMEGFLMAFQLISGVAHDANGVLSIRDGASLLDAIAGQLWGEGWAKLRDSRELG